MPGTSGATISSAGWCRARRHGRQRRQRRRRASNRAPPGLGVVTVALQNPGAGPGDSSRQLLRRKRATTKGAAAGEGRGPGGRNRRATSTAPATRLFRSALPFLAARSPSVPGTDGQQGQSGNYGNQGGIFIPSPNNNISRIPDGHPRRRGRVRARHRVLRKARAAARDRRRRLPHRHHQGIRQAAQGCHVQKNNGDGTATLSGTPAAGTSGSYSLTLTASSGGTTATQTFTLFVTSPPVITSANAAVLTAGQSGELHYQDGWIPAVRLEHPGGRPHSPSRTTATAPPPSRSRRYRRGRHLYDHAGRRQRH